MSDYSALSDNELIRNDPPDSGKTAELISRYMKMVFSRARAYSNLADYEELVSDGMDGLLAAVRGYDDEKGEFASFAAVCVENRLRNTVKRAAKRTSLIDLSDPEKLNDIIDPTPTPEEVVIARESSNEVLERIETELTPLEVQCIRGAVMGMSYDEIANRLNVGKKTVDNALSRARAKLRKHYRY